MSKELDDIFEDEDAPLKRAEHIVEKGPDADAGPLPCEGNPEPQCLTFTDLNRMRFEQDACGCQREEGRIIRPCKAHGEAVTLEETQQWEDDAETANLRLRNMAAVGELDDGD